MNKRGKWTVEVCDTKYPDIKTYNILEENLHPDMVYSGKHFGVCSLDSKEDARLISAAPDMYEALKEADKLIGLARQYFPKSMHNNDKFQLENTCAAIGKAIAKVEGR
jgi:hypothetical protein